MGIGDNKNRHLKVLGPDLFGLDGSGRTDKNCPSAQII